MSQVGKMYRIVSLPGDGVGPEVVNAARTVLDAVAVAQGWVLEIEECSIGGAAIDAAGEPLPQATLEKCLVADAVLLGAVGGPQWDARARVSGLRPEQGLLALRRALGVFANVRPVKAHPALVGASPLHAHLVTEVDLVIVRELTGGLYFGDRGRTDNGARAYDVCEYTVAEVERVARVAGALARARRGTVTSVDKANVLETSRLWREAVTRLFAAEFPDVALEHALVDSMAMHLVRSPGRFDVVLTENMFGDILSDEASVLCGSIGMLPSASLGTADARSRSRGLYEPVHGSAPDIAGQGIANPLGTILSVALMVRHSFGEEAAACVIEEAVMRTVDSGVLTPDLNGSASTVEVAAAVAACLSRDALDPAERTLRGLPC